MERSGIKIAEVESPARSRLFQAARDTPKITKARSPEYALTTSAVR